MTVDPTPVDPEPLARLVRSLKDDLDAALAEVASLTAERDRLRVERDEALAKASGIHIGCPAPALEATVERQRSVIGAARRVVAHWARPVQRSVGYAEAGARAKAMLTHAVRNLPAVAALDGAAATPEGSDGDQE